MITMKLIKTFDGTMAEKSRCRKILHEYYEEGRQCFLMPDNKWHRINNGKILFDHEDKNYVFSGAGLTKGIVGFEKDGTLKLGYFTGRIDKNVKYNNDSETLTSINREIIEKLDATECIGDGIFYSSVRSRVDPKNPKKIYNFRYSQNLDYRCNYRLSEITKSFNELFVGQEFRHQFYKLLPDITFGIEFETFDGRIPEDIMMKNGLIPVKDGSLRRGDGYLPFEYATVILSGKKGLQAVKEQCKVLDKYCEKGLSGSLHVHIGNMPRVKEYVNSIYTLATALQDEIYDMFPQYYRNTSKFKDSGTDYCVPLKSLPLRNDCIESNFDAISSEVCGVKDWKFNKFGDSHPADPGGNHKWNVASRYKIINLTPLLFGGSGTVEFRIHGSTFNHDKIINWLYIISAITTYANKYKDEISLRPSMISGITLNNIIADAYSESNVLVTYLTQYVEYRKHLMMEYAEKGDKCGKLDLENDNISQFKQPLGSIVL